MQKQEPSFEDILKMIRQTAEPTVRDEQVAQDEDIKQAANISRKVQNLNGVNVYFEYDREMLTFEFNLGGFEYGEDDVRVTLDRNNVLEFKAQASDMTPDTDVEYVVKTFGTSSGMYRRIQVSKDYQYDESMHDEARNVYVVSFVKKTSNFDENGVMEI